MDFADNLPVLLDEVARASVDVGETRSRLQKIERLTACLRGLRPDEVGVAVAYLSGELPQGSIGIGWVALRDLPPAESSTPTMELLDVDATLKRIANASGFGSQGARRLELRDLFARATASERRFLLALLTGELRQGAQEGVMVEALAKAGGVPASEVRRAHMLSGDLGGVAEAALAEGSAGVARFRLSVLTPLQPMLAHSAAGVPEALVRIRPAAVEWKLDGARIQLHRLGEEVRVFTRNLADVTERLPEVVESARELSVKGIILDGEAIALRAAGRPHPFQVTMGRFGSRLSVEEGRGLVPLSPFFFDCLHVDGDDLIDVPAADRFAALVDKVPDHMRVNRLVTDDSAEADRFLDAALDRGHEGVMVKSLSAPYEAGRRGASWLKVKRASTLDLVVLAAEWGHGRRRGWLSNLHLGARDPEGGGFVMLGKTFKGMTDRGLAWQTEHLLRLETRRDEYTIHVRPELVVEVAFDGLQRSSRYPGGLALRFARLKGYRPDKRPDDADTIQTVRAMHTGRMRS